MWKEIKRISPPTNIVIETKVDKNGERNIERLIFDGKLWWHTDKSMYVYYQPTHWKEVERYYKGSYTRSCGGFHTGLDDPEDEIGQTGFHTGFD